MWAAVGSPRHRLWGGVLVLVALTAGACGGGVGGNASGTGEGTELSGLIRIDGSSTVAPLSEAATELFNQEQPQVQVTVGTSGTGGGFEKFCAGETDINDASRPIEADEAAACQARGISYQEIQVANDGLSVVVNNDNTWAKCLTVDQLNRIWEPGSTIDNWNQVDPSFPDEELVLYGAGTDSGTFDYFTDAIVGEEGASRTDYNATEDDNVTVQGVSGTKGGLGYFGLSYLLENEGELKALEIDGGAGCVAPSTETVQNATYKPLSRPLLVYPSGKAAQRPEVKGYLEFYLSDNTAIAELALFVPLDPQQKSESEANLAKITSGS